MKCPFRTFSDEAVKQLSSFTWEFMRFSSVTMEESKQKEEKDYRLFRLFSASLRQYFESTSLHGFKYLVQSKADRFTFEKSVNRIYKLWRCSFAINSPENVPDYFGMESKYVHWRAQVIYLYMHLMDL